ncbi:MAG: ABC transporter ATP-binding protein [Ruminococcus sp.]|nr:ABC transporter ATP-binding protein [Ruminococcus sp.]
MENVLKINNIVKKYSGFTLGEINTEIPAGFSTALIGANGAGKTTLIDVICGVTGMDSGNTVYFGGSEGIDSSKIRNRIGYCSSVNFFPFDWKLKNIRTSMETAFDGFSREKFAGLCKKFKLGDPDEKKQKSLVKMSDGNRMRAYLAAVLARDTNLLVLDEPASSLDPLARDMLCDMFREYIAEGNGQKSIIFSTHNIADMEYATDYAIFMADGRITEQGFVEDLKEKYVLVHGEADKAEEAKKLMLSFNGNSTNFEGIAPAENTVLLSKLDTAIEKPTLQQLSVGILRKAEKDGE